MTRSPYFLWIAIVLLALSGCQTTQKMPASSAPVSFIVLQINDVYEIAPLEGGKAGGLARVATVKKELMKENPNTIAVLAGDFLSPSLTGTLKMQDGERIAGLQMVETLNAMGLDYATFGNHEFDLKDAGLLQKRIDQSKFKYVACNAFRKAGDQIKPFTQKIDGKDVNVPKYIVREFANAAGQKVRVGILGVVLPFNKADYVAYHPVEEAVRNTYNEMKSQSDVQIALTHLAVDQDMELARAVPGMHLFAGGHDHTNMTHYVENTVITKADANAKTVYIHRITYYPTDKVTTVRSSLRRIDDGIAEDPGTKAIVERWQENANTIMKQMGYDPGRQILLARQPLICTEAMVRSQQTNFGALTTMAMENALGGGDVYLLNGGSMRLDDDISGVVTEYDALRTFPFGGAIVRMELPGDVLTKLLNIGLKDNRTEGGYMQVSHVEERASGWFVNGQAISAQKKYTVVLPEFVASGKEQNLGFLKDYAFNQSPSFNVGGKSVRNDIRDIVIDYMLKIGTF